MPTFVELGEPFPGWRSPSAAAYVSRAVNGTTLGAVWVNGDWAVSHTATGFRSRRHGVDSKGAPVVFDQATFPSLEAAVMYAELKGDR